MDLHSATTRFINISAICLALAAAPVLAEMVSIKGSIVNMRSGPGTHTDVLWELERGYPLQVIKRQGSWLLVKDFENDRGWVARALTGRTPHHIVKARVANIHSGPGTGFKIVGKAERYELMRTRGSKTGWVRVERGDGVRGWMSKGLLWGW